MVPQSVIAQVILHGSWVCTKSVQACDIARMLCICDGADMMIMPAKDVWDH